MGSRRRKDSGHRNKLYEDSSGSGIAIGIILIVVTIAVVFAVLWSNLE